MKEFTKPDAFYEGNRFFISTTPVWVCNRDIHMELYRNKQYTGWSAAGHQVRNNVTYWVLEKNK